MSDESCTAGGASESTSARVATSWLAGWLSLRDNALSSWHIYAFESEPLCGEGPTRSC